MQDDFCANCLEDGKKMPAVGLCTNCRELMCRLISENVQCSIFSVNWLKCSMINFVNADCLDDEDDQLS